MRVPIAVRRKVTETGLSLVVERLEFGIFYSVIDIDYEDDGEDGIERVTIRLPDGRTQWLGYTTDRTDIEWIYDFNE